MTLYVWDASQRKARKGLDGMITKFDFPLDTRRNRELKYDGLLEIVKGIWTETDAVHAVVVETNGIEGTLSDCDWVAIREFRLDWNDDEEVANRVDAAEFPPWELIVMELVNMLRVPGTVILVGNRFGHMFAKVEPSERAEGMAARLVAAFEAQSANWS